MCRTKKPHYVPSAYLQFWSETGVAEGRNSEFYALSYNETRKCKSGKTAIVKNFYSISNPNDAEDYFIQFERDWSILVNQLIDGNCPSQKVLNGLLILHGSFFLLRNRSFKNKSRKERIEIYKESVEAFQRSVLLDINQNVTLHESVDLLDNNWSCLMLSNDEENFLTTDNPTLTLNSGDNIAIIYLPMTPKLAVIAIRNDHFEFVSNKATKQDVSSLNSYMILNCNREIYSCEPFEENDRVIFRKWKDRIPETTNSFENDTLLIESYNYPCHGLELSFLNKK